MEGTDIIPKTKMYEERAPNGNISGFRGCDFKCSYCAFRNTLRFQKCEKCKSFTPHAHLEVLDRRPPKTKDGQFLTMGLTGDIAFATDKELRAMIAYCHKWSDRTFVLQTKNPRIFEPLTDFIKPNMIIGTTIESDINHGVSKAPPPHLRFESMKALNCRKMITIEPILTFNLNVLFKWIKSIKPEVVYIGYDSKNNHLPEPTLAETRELIEQLHISGIDVKEKLIRKAWYE